MFCFVFFLYFSENPYSIIWILITRIDWYNAYCEFNTTCPFENNINNSKKERKKMHNKTHLLFKTITILWRRKKFISYEISLVSNYIIHLYILYFELIKIRTNWFYIVSPYTADACACTFYRCFLKTRNNDKTEPKRVFILTGGHTLCGSSRLLISFTFLLVDIKWCNYIMARCLFAIGK